MRRPSAGAARRRLSAVAAAARGRTTAPVTPVAASTPAPSTTPILDEIVKRPRPAWHDPSGPVTAALYARLTAEDRADVEAALEGHCRELWDAAEPLVRERLTLIFGAHYGIEGVLTRSGLSTAQPPEDIHAMGRGPLAAGGDPLIADIVVGCLAQAGYEIPSGGAVLDFGGSSGRVVRVLHAWRDDVRWLGCDPNGDAIAWATEHLPGIRFFQSPLRPPMPLADGELDVAFAISIWSHFAEDPARAWLDEMHRAIRPGGCLVVTTHGWDTLAELTRSQEMTPDSAEAAAAAMLSTGHQYYDVFGEEGDWGVKDTGWGNAYLSLEWLAAATAGRWTIDLALPARLAHNQDVIVLRRR